MTGQEAEMEQTVLARLDSLRSRVLVAMRGAADVESAVHRALERPLPEPRGEWS